ncbi:hypothetical protein [Caulobacter vibrioides]|uniref:hypothetical protein n=1 Tax=Caulobacter vibrioides TaxID=155892 RepID=UPI000BB46939|nr:hypothetical protein [Caulobacter vibrioides]ATC25196.1 hypothetical protein CA608_11990 [Caulobacter vibrioides]PLR13966.1 hypothetical protein CVUC_05290 [Caulobacter vibrioides]
MNYRALDDRERYVVHRILQSEAMGSAWATLAYREDQAAALRLARLELVLFAEAGADFTVRRANGVRIEDLA